jgi:RNA-binding protein
MNITAKQKKILRAEGKLLKPEAWIGKSGISGGVLQTIGNSFKTKELVKVKLLANCDIDKHEAASAVANKLKAEVVQIVGKTILFYRALPEEDK